MRSELFGRGTIFSSVTRGVAVVEGAEWYLTFVRTYRRCVRLRWRAMTSDDATEEQEDFREDGAIFSRKEGFMPERIECVFLSLARFVVEETCNARTRAKTFSLHDKRTNAYHYTRPVNVTQDA